MTQTTPLNDTLELSIERVIEAPRPAVWRCWTEADLLKQWYCPKPWQVSQADLDVRPGGRFEVVMAGPEGERIDVPGFYLEVVPERRLVFSDSHTEGYWPRAESFMTGAVELSDAPNGTTRMVWSARHGTAEQKTTHLEMGFEAGWNAAADQLNALARSIAADSPPLGAGHVFKARARTCLFLRDGAEDAAAFYVSLLPDSGIDAVYRPDPFGPPMVVEFHLAGAPYMTMNGNPEPVSSHTASISVLTRDQSETDRLWDALCADGGEEGQCGWLKDRFGVHWQIVPETLPRLAHAGNPDAASRVFDALMQMRKIDAAGLEAAFRGA